MLLVIGWAKVSRAESTDSWRAGWRIVELQTAGGGVSDGRYRWSRLEWTISSTKSCKYRRCLVMAQRGAQDAKGCRVLPPTCRRLNTATHSGNLAG